MILRLIVILTLPVLLGCDDRPLGATFPLGVAVSVDKFIEDNDYRKAVVRNFNLVVPENAMKLRKLAEFDDTQNCRFTGIKSESRAKDFVKVAKENGLRVHGHTWIWDQDFKDGDKEYRKEWDEETIECLQEIKKRDSFDEIEVLLDAYVTRVATMFKGQLTSVDVVNEALCDWKERDSDFCDDDGLRYGEGNPWAKIGARQYIKRAFETARAADDRPTRYYNDNNLWISAWKRGNLIELLKSINKGQKSPLIEGIGLQMHIEGCEDDAKKGSDCIPKSNKFIRNAVQNALEHLLETGLKLRISELEIRYSKPFPDYDQRKLEQYAEVIRTYLDTVPEAQRGGITFWRFQDAERVLHYLGLDSRSPLHSARNDGGASGVAGN